MKRTYIIALLLIGVLTVRCDLQQNPVDSVTENQVFNNESGLEKYANSFYDILPDAEDITHGDAMSDYTSRKTVPDLMLEGVLNPRTVGQWDWAQLREINYFLQNNNSPNISEELKANYNGIARLSRAWFYFDKIKRYGEVPWITEPLNIDSEQLTAARAPRSEVMQHVLDDINFAIENIQTNSDPTRTKITRDVALALKSRIALFEGTYRKYHTDLDLEYTSWLQEAASASEQIIGAGTYQIYSGEGEEESYRALFNTESVVSSEVLLSNIQSANLGVRHDANWWYTSGTYGVGLSLNRAFVNTYLMEDGASFTDMNNYERMSFIEEVQNRDKRLQQTIRMGDYSRNNAGTQVPAPPNFSYTSSGYQPIKWTIADVSLDAGNNNTNSVPIFRYAEILLNYAEAKAELGTITNADWNQTVGELRRRAGITSGNSNLPTQIDPYLQQTYFPKISDPVLLEIRRERGIELALEGFRFDDIKRWKRGELMEMEWKGLYVESANELMDLNGDGTPDVYFYTEEPENRQGGVNYVNVSGNDLVLTNGNSGQLLRLPNIQRTWSEKKYLYPIARQDLLKNPNLEQNPGW